MKLSNGNKLHRRPFEVLLARAHRRRVAWGVAESICIGAASGSGTAILFLSLVALFRIDVSSMTITASLIIMGAAAGAVGVTLRGLPSRLDTADHIDEQTASENLLSTATHLVNAADSPMRSYVLAAADALASRVSLENLILQRFGYRAWGGLALSIVCVLLISLIWPGDSRAQRSGESSSLLESSPLVATEVNTSRDSVLRFAMRGADGLENNLALRQPEPAKLSPGGDRMTAEDQHRSPAHTSPQPSSGVGADRASEPAGRDLAGREHEAFDPIATVHEADAAGIDRMTQGGRGVLRDRPIPGDANVNLAVDGAVNDAVDPTPSPLVEAQLINSTVDAREAGSARSALPAEYRDLVREFFRNDQALHPETRPR